MPISIDQNRPWVARISLQDAIDAGIAYQIMRSPSRWGQSIGNAFRSNQVGGYAIDRSSLQNAIKTLYEQGRIQAHAEIEIVDNISGMGVVQGLGPAWRITGQYTMGSMPLTSVKVEQAKVEAAKRARFNAVHLAENPLTGSINADLTDAMTAGIISHETSPFFGDRYSVQMKTLQIALALWLDEDKVQIQDQFKISEPDGTVIVEDTVENLLSPDGNPLAFISDN